MLYGGSRRDDRGYAVKNSFGSETLSTPSWSQTVTVQ